MSVTIRKAIDKIPSATKEFGRLTNGSNLENSMALVASASPTRDRQILIADARNVFESIAAAGSDMEYSVVRRVALDDGPAREFRFDAERKIRQYDAALDLAWRQDLETLLIPGIRSAWSAFSEEHDEKIVAHFDGRESWASQSDAMDPAIDEATLDASIDDFEMERGSYALTVRVRVSCYGSISVGTQDFSGNEHDYSQQEFSADAELVFSISYGSEDGTLQYQDPVFAIPLSFEDYGWAEHFVRD